MWKHEKSTVIEKFLGRWPFEMEDCIMAPLTCQRCTSILFAIMWTQYSLLWLEISNLKPRRWNPSTCTFRFDGQFTVWARMRMSGVPGQHLMLSTSRRLVECAHPVHWMRVRLHQPPLMELRSLQPLLHHTVQGINDSLTNRPEFNTNLHTKLVWRWFRHILRNENVCIGCYRILQS